MRKQETPEITETPNPSPTCLKFPLTTWYPSYWEARQKGRKRPKLTNYPLWDSVWTACNKLYLKQFHKPKTWKFGYTKRQTAETSRLKERMHGGVPSPKLVGYC